ncbi:hypothetical protein, partial [Streptomyces sp. WAC05858]|uniref:hypothetical protein n=1 Tax=Streptomyces sp. WAC05858 TaxID=2487409 RepID=UPI001C8ED55D
LPLLRTGLSLIRAEGTPAEDGLSAHQRSAAPGDGQVPGLPSQDPDCSFPRRAIGVRDQAGRDQ